MASLNFPSSPTVGQTYVSGGRTWTWNGTSWEGVAATTITGPSGPTGATGAPGDSGYSGISGFSGVSGYSGSGISGYSGTSGAVGVSGYSGLGFDGITSTDTMTPSNSGSILINVNKTGALVVGTRVRVYNSAALYFEGVLTTVDSPGKQIIVSKDYAVGTSSAASWTITVAGNLGTSGYSGYSGLTGPAGLSGYSGFSGSAGTGLTAGSASVGYINYNGTTKTAGQLDGGTTNPTNTTRLNYDGYLYATRFYGDGSQLSGISAGATITDDTTTNGTRYILFDDVTSGSATSVGVSSTKLYFNPSSGTLYATVFQSLSDIQFKTNIETIDDIFNRVTQLRGVKFNWTDDANANTQYGFIAQEIEKVIPELVDSSSGRKTVNYLGIIPLLVEAIKLQQTQLNELTLMINNIHNTLKGN